MTTSGSQNGSPDASGRAVTPGPMPTLTHEPPAVRRRLDQVVRRIRTLYLVSGVSRLLTAALIAVVALYAADRFLVLPVVVRALVIAVLAVTLGLQVWRRILRPLVVGVSRLEAARLVEEQVEGFEGRLVSSLQLGEGSEGSFERRVAEEAAHACESHDLRSVLTARPSLLDLLRASGASLALFLLVVLGQPDLDVFFSRLQLEDTPWPRDTTLLLHVADESPVHVRLLDGSVVASRGGVVNVSATWEGLRPERVDLVVEGTAGTRSGSMNLDSSGRYHGHLTVETGDESIRVKGGDDDGLGNQMVLKVVEPPRLDDPRFLLETPAYLAEAPREVGSEGLSVPEGTRIVVSGSPTARALTAELQLLARAEPIPLELFDSREAAGLGPATVDGAAPEGAGTGSGPGQWVLGEFVAEESDSLSILLAGDHGLATPDPSHHPLVVHADRPPALRIYSPPRSDIKATASALIPFAVVAEDDHGVESVVLDPADGTARPFAQDTLFPGQHRHVLDIRELGLTGTFSYALEAVDGRQLPGKGPQSVRVDGRRIDIVEDSEVQRLLAARQLRLKENVGNLRERQQRASRVVDDLLAGDDTGDSDAGDGIDGELVAAAVAQNQVSTRLVREARELCAILEETITNRLDSGPGAEALLERRMEDWRAQPVDEPFQPGPWRKLSADYTDGRYGRLDLVGRLLDMSGMALTLSEDLSPAAHQALVDARTDPGPAAFQRARDEQQRVEQMLDQLLGRMDEWEDYQEVLSLWKALIDDQKSLRGRTEKALKASGGN
jgi:hypothetical protein